MRKDVLVPMQACVEQLMESSCYREAQTVAEGLLLLGKRLQGTKAGKLIQGCHWLGYNYPQQTSVVDARSSSDLLMDSPMLMLDSVCPSCMAVLKAEQESW
jgi:hypothetical protein